MELNILSRILKRLCWAHGTVQSMITTHRTQYSQEVEIPEIGFVYALYKAQTSEPAAGVLESYGLHYCQVQLCGLSLLKRLLSIYSGSSEDQKIPVRHCLLLINNCDGSHG